jgi:hypothetical protein
MLTSFLRRKERQVFPDIHRDWHAGSQLVLAATAVKQRRSKINDYPTLKLTCELSLCVLKKIVSLLAE